MAFKPNYNQERAARNRSKQQKKQEKLQKRESATTTIIVKSVQRLVVENVAWIVACAARPLSLPLTAAPCTRRRPSTKFTSVVENPRQQEQIRTIF